MSKRGVIAFATAVFLVTTLNSSRAERVYQYEVTVGPGQGYNFATINEAIANIKNNRSTGDLACIWIYPKTGGYEEQLRDTYTYTAPAFPCGDGQVHTFNANCHSLPVDCDLRKPSSESGEVKIVHYAPPAEGLCEGQGCENCPNPPGGIQPYWHIAKYGVDCKGNNVLEGLTIYNPYVYLHKYVQASVNMNGYGEVRNCVISTGHGPAITGSTAADLVVSNCTVSRCNFGSCIQAYGPFSISDCTLTPTWTWNGEMPTGIEAGASGTIERVLISANVSDVAGSYNDYGVFGIQLLLASNESVEILDSQITLQMTSKYDTNPTHQPQASRLRVCGILSGNTWKDWPYGGYFPGNAVVQDCTINVKGIEDDNGTPEDEDDDGADIMVDGVCVRGGGTVEVYGCSSIATSWTPAGSAGEGYEYLLNEENGTLGASFPGIQFDPTGDQYFYPSKDVIDPLWGIGFRIEDDSGDAMAVFDYCGNLMLNGVLTDEQTWPSATMDDEFIVEHSAGNNLAVISGLDGDMFIHGLVKLDSNNDWLDPDIGQDEFIICDKDGDPVAYIDESGNVYLKGGVFEEFELIEW